MFVFFLIYATTMPLQRFSAVRGEEMVDEEYLVIDMVSGISFCLYNTTWIILCLYYQLYWLQILELKLMSKR